MTDIAVQAVHILRWALIPDDDPALLAVVAAGQRNDIDGALNALVEGREKVGALSYMIDELLQRVTEHEQGRAA